MDSCIVERYINDVDILEQTAAEEGRECRPYYYDMAYYDKDGNELHRYDTTTADANAREVPDADDMIQWELDLYGAEYIFYDDGDPDAVSDVYEIRAVVTDEDGDVVSSAHITRDNIDFSEWLEQVRGEEEKKEEEDEG